MKVAVLGYGTVGRGVYDMLRASSMFEAGPVLVRPGKTDETFKVDSIDAIVNDESVDAVAEELGLPFTLRDLRVYESVMSAKRCPDEEMTEEELSESGEYSYWFNGRGWSYDKNMFKD